MAVTLTTEDLHWHRELLLETAKHAVGGCDERVWSAAATTAVAVVLTLEGQSISHECLTSFLSAHWTIYPLVMSNATSCH